MSQYIFLGDAPIQAAPFDFCGVEMMFGNQFAHSRTKCFAFKAGRNVLLKDPSCFF